MSSVSQSLDGQGTWLRIPVTVLTLLMWASMILFGGYILARHGARFEHNLATNDLATAIDRIFRGDSDTGKLGILLHFLMGALILFVGPLQFFGPLRRNFPAVHRWMGRSYILAAIVTAVGGLTYIITTGTVGRMPMSIAFSLYGVLMLVAAMLTVTFAIRKDFERHRNWAIRLFALAIGSWLYRIEYGMIFALGQKYPEISNLLAPGFQGPLDYVMNYFFFVPNLMIAELIIAGVKPGRPLMRGAAAIGLSFAIILLALATYAFGFSFWLPTILRSLGA